MFDLHLEDLLLKVYGNAETTTDSHQFVCSRELVLLKVQSLPLLARYLRAPPDGYKYPRQSNEGLAKRSV